MHDGYAIRGLELRYALTVLLLDGGVLTVDDMVRLLAAAGFAVGGRPSKTVSDALRWETGRGRVIRLGRGRYGAGRMPRQTKCRIRARVEMVRKKAAAARFEAVMRSSVNDPLSLRGGTVG